MKTYQDPTFEPDCFDLNDWICLKHPEFYARIKYLSNNYNVMLLFWKEHGRPDISQTWKV